MSHLSDEICSLLQWLPTDFLCGFIIFIQFQILVNSSFVLSVLPHELFRSILFTYQVFENFLETFCWLTYNLNPLWLEPMCCITCIILMFGLSW